jgi:hypothetical protein
MRKFSFQFEPSYEARRPTYRWWDIAMQQLSVHVAGANLVPSRVPQGRRPTSKSAFPARAGYF